jgi:uncharacterized membrane protein
MVCAAWTLLSLAGLLVLGTASIFKQIKKGDDLFTQLCVAFYQLPVWGMILVIVLAAYGVAYAIKNKKYLEQKFTDFSVRLMNLIAQG